jgi:hypothetical protein
MALRRLSSFLFGYEVTPNNRSIDFVRVSLGPTLQATLDIGFYSLSGLLREIKRAMEEVDTINTYTVTADRSVAGGTQNRVTISTSGTFLSLLFASGPRSASSVATLIGFAVVDQTGTTTYTGTSSSGTILNPNFFAYNFIPPTIHRKNFGTLNVSASGDKEAVVFAIQEFWQAQFKEIPEASLDDWSTFMTWSIAQKPLEFTPSVDSPNTFYEGTLESTAQDGKGLAFKFTEMLPQKPFYYDTGLMTFRRKVTS